MRAVPVPFLAFLDWVQRHARAWAEHAPQIGVPVAVAEDFSLATDRVTRAHAALEAARNALVTAQAEKDAAEAEARRQAGFIVSMIRSFVASKKPQGEGVQLEILAKAAIESVRVSSTPLPPPEMPRPGEATLRGANGHLTLSWQARQPRNARGTIYQVERAWVEPSSRRERSELLGHTPQRTFTDTALPPGVAEFTYRITAQRSGQNSPTAIMTVTTAGRAAA